MVTGNCLGRPGLGSGRGDAPAPKQSGGRRFGNLANTIGKSRNTHDGDVGLERAREVKAWAAAEGFDACGIAPAGAADPQDRLGQWLGRGFHADMAWMERTRAERQDIQLRLPGAQSVVVVARNYYSGEAEPPPHASGRVARYAWGRDYHRALRKPLKRLAERIGTFEAGSRYSISIDSSPVLERTWAERAGVGWVGKNSLILRRDMGSYFFLAVILTTVELAPDASVTEACGTCRACLDACPTQAIVEPGVVDSNRCISYHTIENRGDIPESIQARMGDWVFGCDVCQEVCPWNRFATMTDATDFHARPGQSHLDLDEIQRTSREDFDTRFAGTPIRRPGLEGMKRNAAIVTHQRASRTAGEG